MNTNQEDYLDWMQMENIRYKINYNPFLIFQPTKSFLKEVIKQLKQQCYELIEQNNREEGDNKIFTELANQPKLDALNARIRSYMFRLQPLPKDGGNRIDASAVARAKEQPIALYYNNGKLRRSGRTLIGRCPFHDERTGSFTIYESKNRFICFGCGEKGDVIDFICKTQNLKFIEAVKWILKIQ